MTIRYYYSLNISETPFPQKFLKVAPGNFSQKGFFLNSWKKHGKHLTTESFTEIALELKEQLSEEIRTWI